MLVGGHEEWNEQLFVGLVGVQQAGHLPPSPQSHFTLSLKSLCLLSSVPLYMLETLNPDRPSPLINQLLSDTHTHTDIKTYSFFSTVVSKREAQTCDCIITATILDHPSSFLLVWMGSVWKQAGGLSITHISFHVLHWGAGVVVKVLGASKTSLIKHNEIHAQAHTHTIWSNWSGHTKVNYWNKLVFCWC